MERITEQVSLIMARSARIVKIAVLFFTLAGFASAQSPTGSIAGVIREKSVDPPVLDLELNRRATLAAPFTWRA